MCKRLALSVIFVLIACLRGAAPAPFVWFDRIQEPASLDEKACLLLTQGLHRGLKQQLPLPQLLQGLADDSTPRIVFLTIGDDLWPARTYFGTGFSLHDALRQALQLLRLNEAAKSKEIIKHGKAIVEEARQAHRQPPRDWLDRMDAPGRWQWLKLHIVQAAKPYPHFLFNHSRFAFSDLVGFAFSPDLGFAFTPDQITGRYLLTPQHFISKKQVGNIIAEAFNFEALSTWLRTSTVQQPQTIHLFETDVYYTDGITPRRLFRGHELPFVPTASQCQEAALRGVKAVAERLDPHSGNLASPFPDWRQPKPDAESLEDLAAFALSVQYLSQATGNRSLEDAARHAMISVKSALLPYDQRRKAAIAELEPMPANSPRQPRTIATLRTNALGLMAMLQAPGRTPQDTQSCKLIAAFIADLKKADGDFNSAMAIPSGLPLNRKHSTWQTQAEDNALAVLALQRAGKALGNQAWQKQSQQALRRLISSLAPQADLHLAQTSPWIAEALTATAPQSVQQVKCILRLATALLNARNLAPLAPDLTGALRDYPPNTTAAARNTWAAATLATCLRPLKPDYEEALAAGNAVTVSFHLQARMTPAASSSLPRPRFYTDFFRNSLDSFDFDLRGQTTQIFALAKNASLLSAYHGGVFPDAATASYLLMQTRKLLKLHPAYLNTETVSNQRGISEEARSVMGEISNRKKTHVTPEESGLFTSDQNSGIR